MGDSRQHSAGGVRRLSQFHVRVCPRLGGGGRSPRGESVGEEGEVGKVDGGGPAGGAATPVGNGQINLLGSGI